MGLSPSTTGAALKLTQPNSIADTPPFFLLLLLSPLSLDFLLSFARHAEWDGMGGSQNGLGPFCQVTELDVGLLNGRDGNGCVKGEVPIRSSTLPTTRRFCHAAGRRDRHILWLAIATNRLTWLGLPIECRYSKLCVYVCVCPSVYRSALTGWKGKEVGVPYSWENDGRCICIAGDKTDTDRHCVHCRGHMQVARLVTAWCKDIEGRINWLIPTGVMVHVCGRGLLTELVLEIRGREHAVRVAMPQVVGNLDCLPYGSVTGPPGEWSGQPSFGLACYVSNCAMAKLMLDHDMRPHLEYITLANRMTSSH